MKKILLLLFAVGLSFGSFAQSDSKIWIGIDGSYWNKSVKGGITNDFGSEFSSSIRPMVGYQLSPNWSLGILANFQSYRLDLGQSSLTDYGQSSFYPTPVIFYEEGLENQLFGIGLFARRHVAISEKLSLNFSLYTLRESGNDGQIERYFQFPPFTCVNCASVANPIRIPFEEINWKTGLDVGFAFQANEWLALELRANLIELRLQEVSDPNSELFKDFVNPLTGSIQSYYGDFTDFGSAVRRDGIRFGLVFTPF
jgi:hypothetical protein